MTEEKQISISIKVAELEYENILLKEEVRSLAQELHDRKRIESLNKYFEVSNSIPPLNYE